MFNDNASVVTFQFVWWTNINSWIRWKNWLKWSLAIFSNIEKMIKNIIDAKPKNSWSIFAQKMWNVYIAVVTP